MCCLRAATMDGERGGARRGCSLALALRAVAPAVLLLISVPALADSLLFSDPSGLSAEVEFTLLDPTTLEVRARNTSTDVPDGFSNADQLLTAISWDFGLPGIHADDPAITGGWVIIGPTSASLNFDTGSYGAGADVSGEYGYGNEDGSGGLPNLVSALTAGATGFGGPNLDGPVAIDGPQGGLAADPVLVDLGELGAIQNEIIATLMIDTPLVDLDFLNRNMVRVEFGSDAAFITYLPVPGAAVLVIVGLGTFAWLRRRIQ